MQLTASAATQRGTLQAQCKGAAASCRPARAPRARLTRVRANMDRETGFVEQDNSGRANIFPTKQQAYIKSSTADAAASQGLGGAQGGILLGFVLAAVVAATVLGAKAPGPETLQSVEAAFQGDSLAEIAARVKASM